MTDQDEEETENEVTRKKKTFFLGERKVEAENQVTFENGVFFVERASEFLVIRPKVMKKYASEFYREDGSSYKTLEFERGAKEIIVPLRVVDTPMKWFEERYISDGRQNQQGRFIREIWKHRDEVFGEVNQ